MVKKKKKKIWKGEWYYRKQSKTYRNRRTGAIRKKGRTLGFEVVKRHFYSKDTPGMRKSAIRLWRRPRRIRMRRRRRR